MVSKELLDRLRDYVTSPELRAKLPILMDKESPRKRVIGLLDDLDVDFTRRRLQEGLRVLRLCRHHWHITSHEEREADRQYTKDYDLYRVYYDRILAEEEFE